MHYRQKRSVQTESYFGNIYRNDGTCTLLVDVGRHVNCALVDVDADVVEMFVFIENKLGRVESFRHRIAYLSYTINRQ